MVVNREKKQKSLDSVGNRNRKIKNNSNQLQKQSDVDGLCINSRRNLVKVKYGVDKSRTLFKEHLSNSEEGLIKETYSSLLKETLKTEYIQTDQDRQ